MIISAEEKRAAARMREETGAKMMRRINLVLCVLLFSGVGVLGALYGWASYRVGELGLDAGRRPLEGAVVVRGVRLVSVNMTMPRAALARELDAAGFTAAEAGGDKEGNYSLVGDTFLQLHGEAGLLQVHFGGGKIDAIQDAKNENVEALQIPSPVLFRMHTATEDLSSLFSQREFYMQEGELKGSVLPDVLVPTEDRAFPTHGGVAPKSILAAGLDTLRGAKMRGAGTISEQLGRTLIWPDEDIGQQSKLHKCARKMLEFFLASALERRFSKDDILRFYAESVDVGTIETAAGQRHQVRGFKALAFYLYGVRDMRKLSLAQAAAMVSVLTKPNYYLAHLDELRTRRDQVVLKNFAEQHPEQAATARAAMEEPLGFVRVRDGEEESEKESYGFVLDAWRVSPEFKSEARGPESLNLSVDPILQDAAATALRDEILELRRRDVPDVEGAIVAMDPETGQVRALVGADRFPALDAARQSYRTGSAVKPFYYARALEDGSVNGEPLTPATQLNLSDCAIGAWQPNDGEGGGGFVSTTNALARSSDCGAVVVAKSLGLQKACDAIVLSLQNRPICSGPALLGGASGSETSPLHMAEAYAAFANGGDRVEAQFMQTTRKATNATRLFSPQAAFVATSLMESVMRNGTGAQALAWSGLPKGASVAGKTGTDPAEKFLLAVVQPRLIVVVMISAGIDKALTEQAGYTGGLISGRVWADFLRRSLPVAPYYFGGRFQQPSGVAWLEVDRSRGCLQPGTNDNEVFVVGRVPRSCY